MTTPRLYKPRINVFWWLGRRSYTMFVLRELSSLFVGWAVVYLLLLIRAVAAGSVAYQRFLHWSASPWAIALNIVTVVFLVYHTVTFINLTPQAMVVQMRGRRVPPQLLLGPLYLAWIVVSAVLLWLVMV